MFVIVARPRDRGAAAVRRTHRSGPSVLIDAAQENSAATDRSLQPNLIVTTGL